MNWAHSFLAMLLSCWWAVAPTGMGPLLEPAIQELWRRTAWWAIWSETSPTIESS